MHVEKAYTCRNALGTVTLCLKSPNPKDPTLNDRSSRSSSSGWVMNTLCAGAVALGSFSNLILYSRTTLAGMKFASP